MTVPYTFAASSGSIPLSYLDSNFATTITMGNTAVQLGDTITTFNNVTLASPTITSPNMSGVTITSGNVTTTTITATTGTFSGNVQMASANGSCLAGLRNRLINGGFNVNQRGVSGTVTLAAGAYGHDRWKGGASGCTYTFATVANVTTLTISAGSLIQVIEGINLETGTYCLSWSGTATAKIGAGSLSASGVTGSITGGTNTNIEISTGTVSKVQLELSPIPTTFESTRPYGMELELCQRYYWASIPGSGTMIVSGITPTAGYSAYEPFKTPVMMRAAPIANVVGTWVVSNSTQPTIGLANAEYIRLSISSIGVGQFYAYDSGAGRYITADAEL
jgi:hypothetical protein